jgi:hypothetical protein
MTSVDRLLPRPWRSFSPRDTAEDSGMILTRSDLILIYLIGRWADKVIEAERTKILVVFYIALTTRMSSNNSSCGDNEVFRVPSWDEEVVFVLTLVLWKVTWEFLSSILYFTSFCMNTTSSGQNRTWNYWVMSPWKTWILGSNILLYKHAL